MEQPNLSGGVLRNGYEDSLKDAERIAGEFSVSTKVVNRENRSFKAQRDKDDNWNRINFLPSGILVRIKG